MNPSDFLFMKYIDVRIVITLLCLGRQTAWPRGNFDLTFQRIFKILFEHAVYIVGLENKIVHVN